MDYFNAIFLAIIEGVTEFLPVSSTGHLILAESLVTLGDDRAFSDAFIVIIQLPAILSVCVYFWAELWPVKQGKLDNSTIALWVKVVAAFVPAVIFGLLLDDWLETLFDDLTVAIALILGGVIIILVERRHIPVQTESVHELTFKQAIAIGFFQCLAMIPGTSRSAATIVGGLLLGASRSAAAEFSFFLAIPTMIGATTLKVVKNGLDFTGHQWALLAVGSAVSFVVAYAVVAFLMAYIKKHSFTAFGIYRIILGGIVLVFLKYFQVS